MDHTGILDFICANWLKACLLTCRFNNVGIYTPKMPRLITLHVGNWHHDEAGLGFFGGRNGFLFFRHG
ncbi:hypothetical protein DY926_12360 [Komagataeibacter melaceti]|uniref:Uncharacterized protein n=1 Tax=Komagataeibacter melaceti TaxID=2766577 RepID=A0A371YYD1_9PROT|nr:hypothetical protein DY926_12360 [Komagataeibacter melaceti]